MAGISKNIDTILGEAVEIDLPAERQAYLDGACSGDVELRARVEQLIANHFSAGDFLEQPVAGLSATVVLPASEQVGAMVGRYKLLEQIGEGGMGVVYVAEQTEPVRRKVALKIIKPGMDTRQVIARFEAEQQALAMMDHPNIAKVLDANTTESGRPYFVMELVRGVPITEFCDQRRLDPRRRLELFVQVCRAIQHAHQKGIIHRDIKPTNILVTLHDELAVPKVIDFGIAKATGQRLTEHSVYTAFNQMIGTPLYMSPEQAEMNALDVDTRSDVYSLGVLLYELLTGSTPFDSETLRQAGFDEMRRLIREVDPPRPSQRVSTLDAQAASTVSKSRGVDERRLSRALRGDLDWIVMMALEKDRSRRYESASALAADVQRHLDNEPIRAKQPRLFASARKWSRRHRTATTAAAVAAILLLMFATGMAADRHRQVREATRFVETSLQAGRTALEADDVNQAVQRLSEAQTRIDADRLADQALVEEVATLLQESEHYAKFVPLLKKARFHRDDSQAGIAPAKEALALYGVMENPKWLDALRAAGPPEAHITRVTEGVYELLLAKADAFSRWALEGPDSRGQFQLKKQCPRALECLDKAISFHAPSRGYYWLLANCSLLMGDKDKATRLWQTALETPPHDAGELFYINHDRDWGTVSHNRHFPKYSFEENYKSHREMLRLDPQYYNGLFFMGLVLGRESRHEEALVAWYGCFALNPNDATALANRGLAHFKLGHFDEALADAERAISLAPENPTGYGIAAWILATCPADEFRNGERAVELANQARKLTHYSDANDADTLAAAYAEAGDFAAAVKWSEKALHDARREEFQQHLDSFRSGKPWREIPNPKPRTLNPNKKPGR